MDCGVSHGGVGLSGLAFWGCTAICGTGLSTFPAVGDGGEGGAGGTAVDALLPTE